MKVDSSRPGKPTENAFVASSIELFAPNWFVDLNESKRLLDAWSGGLWRTRINSGRASLVCSCGWSPHSTEVVDGPMTDLLPYGNCLAERRLEKSWTYEFVSCRVNLLQYGLLSTDRFRL